MVVLKKERNQEASNLSVDSSPKNRQMVPGLAYEKEDILVTWKQRGKKNKATIFLPYIGYNCFLSAVGCGNMWAVNHTKATVFNFFANFFSLFFLGFYQILSYRNVNPKSRTHSFKAASCHMSISGSLKQWGQ